MSIHYSAQVGFSTTIDVAQKQKQEYNVKSQAGAKRPYAEEANVFAEIAGNSPGFKRPCLAQSEKSSCIKASKINNIVGNEDGVGRSLYTQRNMLGSTPTPTQNPLLSLSHPRYGLPRVLVDNLTSMGIRSIYPWQSSCLLGRGLLTGEKNLVYTAPTGGGKSLVADILMLKRVLEHRKKAILVLPYVALVQEKLKWLRRAVHGLEKDTDQTVVSPESVRLPRGLLEHDSVRVVGFFGGSKAREAWIDVDIAVCTIEKANSLVNAAIEDGTVSGLGAVVLDELHMIDDENRGYLLELLATKLLSMEHGVQVVGMSATLSNTEVLANWLGAKYYQSKYMPVPIEEYLVYDHAIYPASTSSTFFKTTSQLRSTQPTVSVVPVRVIETSKEKALRKPLHNAVVALAVETAESGCGALVFCGGRLTSQVTAELISEAMPPELNDDIFDLRKEVLSELRSLPVGLDETLGRTIIRGVGFHHAGLTIEEREILADAYDHGIIRVIVATCSLAAGINLPARRVILQGARMGRDLVGPAMLRQMRGRAGRKGKDELGESYVCCQESDLEEVAQLLELDLPAVTSCLTPEKRGLKRALLEVIAVRLANHSDAVQDYIRRTLLYHTVDPSTLNEMVEATIEELLTIGFISIDDTKTYIATQLGQAVVAASLTPEDGVFVYGELQRALRAFVMDGEMHIFYTFTPVQSSGLTDINWPIFRKEMEGLNESGLRVLEFVGVNPAFVNRMANGARGLQERTPQEIDSARIYRRFYAALQLRDLCNEIPIHAVARKYETPRGFVQNLAQTCQGFAAGMIKFCGHMGWGMLSSVLEHMSDRLKAGAKADLLELAQIPFVKSRTARVFWENGLKSLRAVAEAEPKDLVPVLLLAQAKKSKINGDEESKYHEKLMGKAEIIVSAANRLWERQQQVDIEIDL